MTDFASGRTPAGHAADLSSGRTPSGRAADLPSGRTPSGRAADTELATRPGFAPGARALYRALGLAAATTRILVEDGLAKEPSALDFAERAQRTARAILSVHDVDVRISGGVPTRPSVLVANHLGYLDPLVIAAAIPCIAIAKGETRRWLLIGAGLEGLGVLFVRREDAHSGAVVLRRVWRALEQGAMVLNFPEGTTGDGSVIGPFRRGIFGLKRLAGVDIVPVRLTYGDPRVPWYGGASFLPHYWTLAKVPRVVAHVRFGQPLPSHPYETAAELAVRAREAVLAL
jgi:1-acyl-sn-glycerol-3-phosphate acyltransferase